MTWIVEWDRCPASLKNGTKMLCDLWVLERVHKLLKIGCRIKRSIWLIWIMHLFHFVVDLVTDKDLCSAASSLTVTTATANSSPLASSATATTTTANLPQRTKPKPNQDKRAEEELLKANAVLTELSNGLRESIGGIVCTFGDKLVSFRYWIHGLLLMSGSRSLLGIVIVTLVACASTRRV